MVDEKYIGVGFGIMQTLENACGVITSPLAGFIKENTQKYRYGYLWA